MTSSPWVKWYWADWRSDPRLRMCSLAARGLWAEMLALMHEASPHGHLLIAGRAPTDAQLAVLAGAPSDQIPDLLGELEAAGVFSRTREGVAYSRRMVRDAKKFAMERKHGAKGGNPKLKGDYALSGYVYLIGPRSDGAIKIGASVNPFNRIKKIRAQYAGQDLRVLRQWPVENMGSSERTLHEKFAQKSDGEWFSLSHQDIEAIEEYLDPKGSGKGVALPQKPEARSQKPEDANASTARDAGAEKSDDRVIAARRAITATWQRLSNDPNRPSIDTGILNVWVASGFDPAICEAVVVSGLESALPRGKSVRSLKWFEEAVREAHDKRAPAKAPQEAPDWQALVARYSRSKLWPSPLGPAPGFAGCRVPLDILVQHGFERAA